MVIPYGMVGAQWWDAHFLSLDYGFGKSTAAIAGIGGACLSNASVKGLLQQSLSTHPLTCYAALGD
jgi:hypothetical protein